MSVNDDKEKKPKKHCGTQWCCQRCCIINNSESKGIKNSCASLKVYHWTHVVTSHASMHTVWWTDKWVTNIFELLTFFNGCENIRASSLKHQTKTLSFWETYPFLNSDYISNFWGILRLGYRNAIVICSQLILCCMQEEYARQWKEEYHEMHCFFTIV